MPQYRFARLIKPSNVKTTAARNLIQKYLLILILWKKLIKKLIAKGLKIMIYIFINREHLLLLRLLKAQSLKWIQKIIKILLRLHIRNWLLIIILAFANLNSHSTYFKFITKKVLTFYSHYKNFTQNLFATKIKVV